MMVMKSGAKKMKLFYPEIDLVDGNNVVDFEKWFELLNPNLTAVVALLSMMICQQ